MIYKASPNTPFGQSYYDWHNWGAESLRSYSDECLEMMFTEVHRLVSSDSYADDDRLHEFCEAILAEANERFAASDDEDADVVGVVFNSMLHQVAAPDFDPDTYDPELISMRDTIEENVPTDGTRHTLFLHHRTNTFYVRFHDWKNGQEPQLVDVPKGKSPNECYEHPVGMLGL